MPEAGSAHKRQLAGLRPRPTAGFSRHSAPRRRQPGFGARSPRRHPRGGLGTAPPDPRGSSRSAARNRALRRRPPHAPGILARTARPTARTRRDRAGVVPAGSGFRPAVLRRPGGAHRPPVAARRPAGGRRRPQRRPRRRGPVVASAAAGADARPPGARRPGDAGTRRPRRHRRRPAPHGRAVAGGDPVRAGVRGRPTPPGRGGRRLRRAGGNRVPHLRRGPAGRPARMPRVRPGRPAAPGQVAAAAVRLRPALVGHAAAGVPADAGRDRRRAGPWPPTCAG
jgi:hypothetical protein